VNPVRRSGIMPIEAGATFGKYEIMRRLALGGMAEIFLARVTGPGGFEKIVVLKRVLSNIADDDKFVEMFLDEARLAATLQHPNIADVYDVGEAEGSPFMAMEFVYGQDSRALRMTTRERREKIPLAVSLAIIHGVASALDYAHARRGADGKPLQLVHRDVSASNIMISYDGAVKLLDFGIARATSHQTKTVTGTLKGKVPYMSPEQCRGQPLDRRSDLFSLGIVMFELTVGRRPFRGDNDFDVMDKIVHGRAPAPSTIVDNYPADLEAIVMKLLEHDPALRYQTAEGMLHDLDAFLAKHRLWISSKSIGKYMRHLFSAKIAAWERAESDGVTLGEHLTSTGVTPPSQPSAELVTPTSAIAALPASPMSQEFAAVQSLEYSAGVQRISDIVKVHAPLPEAPSSPGHTLGILVGIVLGSAAIVGGYLFWRDYAPTTTASAAQPAPVIEPAAAPPPAPPPPPAAPKAAAKSAPVVTPIESAPKQKPAAPAPPKPAVKQVAPPPAPPAPPKRVKATRPPPPPPPPQQQQPAPPKPAEPPPKPKEPTWDPNSPFLPPPS
jgi:serine/threonine protein kinase